MPITREGKRKRVSKKNKISWRKNVDITDVENYLEDQRLEERLGTPFADKTDSELFIVDTAPSGPDAEQPAGDLILSTKQRKRAKLVNSLPKCFASLESTSKVQDPITKRNILRAVGSRPTALSKLSDERKLRKGIYGRKVENTRMNLRNNKLRKLAIKNCRSEFDRNVWGDGESTTKSVAETLKSEWATEEIKQLNIPCGKRKQPPRQKKMSSIPAIEVPHPGTSYNPSFEDHQDLLREVAAKEEQLMKKERRITRLTTDMYKLVRGSNHDEIWLKEMLVGLPDMPRLKENAKNKKGKKNTEEKAVEEKCESSEESDSEYKAVNPPVQNKKKDHKARRKQREQKVEADKRTQVKIEKKKVADLHRLRFLTTALTRADERLARLRVIRDEHRARDAEFGTRKLNAHKYSEPDQVFPLAEELSGNLRNIQSQGSLLKDRYQSLQKRSILAPTKIFLKKKTKVKVFAKPGHKVTEKDIAKYME